MNLTLDQAGIALSFCDQNDRETWVLMGMALKSEFGDDAFQIWDSWSSQAQSYKQKNAQAVWRSIKPHGGVKIGTLLKEAQNNGFKFEAEKNIISQEEIERRKIEREKREKESKEETERLQEQAKKHALTMWESSSPATNDHPYLKRKNVSAKGIRVGTWKAITGDGRTWLTVPNALFVPVKNENRELVSIQAIFEKEHPKLGRDKDFITGGQKSGCFYGFGSLPKDGSRTRIVIGEGYATMATIHDATGYICIVAFDAGNLTNVANIIRKQNPDAELLIAADNDKKNPKNTGVESAKRAALESNAKLAIPIFNSDDLSLTDFNDLAKSEGLEAVKNAINSGFNYGNDVDNDIAICDMPEYDFVGFEMVDDVEIDHQGSKSEKQTPSAEPFKVLGYYEDKIFILPRESNQIRTISYGSMTENTLISIAPLEWWESRFIKKSGFDLKAAIDTIFRKAHRQGIFLTDRLRGRGCWIDSNRTVFHLGNRLLVNGEYFDLSDFDSRYIYQQDKPFPKFDHLPILTKEEGAEILMLADKFRWSIPASSLLLAGWCVLAPICGALKWRPHIWITGGAGSGKSTIIDEFVNSLMGGVAVFAQGNSSEAGLRQHLKSDAVPVIFDEAEQNTEREQKSMQAVLALIRQSSSESGAKTLKGTATGVGMTYHIRSMFCMASIQVGIQQQADRERLTILQLREKEDIKQDETNNWEEIKEELYKLKRDSETSLRLLNRTVSMLPTVIESIKIFVGASAHHFGNQRTGDQYGTLLAGAWVLVNDAPPTKEQANLLISSSDWTDYTSTKKGNDPVLALDALLSLKLRSSQGAEFTIFELLDCIAADKGIIRASDVSPALSLKTNDANDVFQRYGMRYDHTEKALLISNNSDSLESLMKNTKYAADIRGLLLRNKSVRKITTPKRFAGGVARCIGISILDIV